MGADAESQVKMSLGVQKWRWQVVTLTEFGGKARVSLLGSMGKRKVWKTKENLECVYKPKGKSLERDQDWR